MRLILIILEITDRYLRITSKIAAYADDLTAATFIKEIQYHWEQLHKLGTKFGYFPEATK